MANLAAVLYRLERPEPIQTLPQRIAEPELRDLLISRLRQLGVRTSGLY